jgi:hypothetical protein
MKRIETDLIAFPATSELAERRTEPELGYCDDLIRWARGSKFATLSRRSALAVSEQHRKGCPEHKRLRRYNTMSLQEIMALPVSDIAQETAHLYLWVPMRSCRVV